MPGRRSKKAQTTPLYARKTTQLPPKLKDELVSLGKIAPPKAKRQNLDPTTATGRKQLRKQERSNRGNQSQERGLRSESHDDNQSSAGARQSEKRAAPTEDRKGKKRQKRNDDASFDSADTTTPESQDEPGIERPTGKASKKTPLQRLLDKSASGSSGGKSIKKSRPVPSGSATTIEEQEAQEIAWLEAQLGLGKNSKSRKEFEEDGLDGKRDLHFTVAFGEVTS